MLRNHVSVWRLEVRGLVQGVGFRPFVWRLAHALELAGSVRNTPRGVIIEIASDPQTRDSLISSLRAELPRLARIDDISIMAAPDQAMPSGFTILDSLDGKVAAAITPDAAICHACSDDVLEPVNRRFGYAFANCTHCGPRLTIVRKIPYDRANTAMSKFPMCQACRCEYEDTADRRFHAEPIACAQCGPGLWLESADGRLPVLPGDEIAAAASLLGSGGIVALKGLGGFHVACRADNEAVIQRLRHRKRRDAKPFAVMARNVEQIALYARISAAEASLLSSPAGPIVLLEARSPSLLPPVIAPDQDRIGFMLPTTPLHLLLMEAVGSILVMTSANMSGEPQFIDNGTAGSQLFNIADAILFHNRDIENRADDSVVRFDTTGPTILRRARGYAPAPLLLPQLFHGKAPVFATGADIKAAFCLAENGGAILSQHLGDLDEPATLGEYRRTADLYMELFEHRPDVIAHDMHPAYRSAKLAHTLAAEFNALLLPVQHHHAHLAACMAENHSQNIATLGIILDGAGYGTDGTIWGGEFLAGNYSGYQRVAHFQPVPLLGGDKAATEPWRNAYAHLQLALGKGFTEGEFKDLPVMRQLATKPIMVLESLMLNPRLAPLSSSAGRLFDAFASIIGVAQMNVSYEGQTGMRLETLAGPQMETATPFDMLSPLDASIISWHRLWHCVLHELKRGADAGHLSARFHQSLIKIVSDMAIHQHNVTGIDRIALSGGVFQNSLLLQGVHAALEKHGLQVLVHHSVPANDGGIALGQAAIAMANQN
ncbi:carbamoyltransferase HypF [Rhizobium aegyptiacum]|uniref:carbamoyltransferase HypF n=1 Tax=Rhizobium aegyptiacum TaxID=1764550 RepID=UPI0007E5AA36|nr:carbamoyltransferase HypF [Rhizobium aegyptiacum]